MSDGMSTLVAQNDVFDALLDPEVQQSLQVLVQQLPKLTEITTLLVKAYDVSSEALKDGETLEGVTRLVHDSVQPLQEKFKDGKAAVEEAKLRADKDSTHISVFTLLKLLKDPLIQKNLRFVFALLNVLGEKKADK
jgi:uncharacterized protein YjgD (DUF1641 family)